MTPNKGNEPKNALPSNSPEMCQICHTTINDKLNFGDKYSLNGIVVHHYCLLFSDDLEQNGSDRCGILGFLYKDIHKVIKKNQNIKCNYCHCFGPCSRCKECKIYFHRPCGLVNGGISIFDLNYYSLCGKHRPKKTLSEQDIEEGSGEKPVCYICLDRITNIRSLNCLKTKCCSKSWLHRRCLTMLALSEGINFNCPKCRNVEKFQRFAIQEGMYIPNRDYSWELEPNAFESHRRALVCSISPCVHPSANKPLKRKRPVVVFCTTCGGSAAHKVCAKLAPSDEYLCQECKDIYNAINKRKHNEEENNLQELDIKKRKHGLNCPQQDSKNEFDKLDEEEVVLQEIKKRKYDLNNPQEDCSGAAFEERDKLLDVVNDQQPSCSYIKDITNELRKQPPRNKKRNTDFKYNRRSYSLSDDANELRKQPPRIKKRDSEFNYLQPSCCFTSGNTYQ